MARWPMMTAEARFWTKVQKAGDDECWLWTGGRMPSGYGRFVLGPNRYVGAHRFAFEIANGPVPAGLQVCHHCDTPRCCNPRHLFTGTAKENSQDAARKGRTGPQRHPEKYPNPIKRAMPAKEDLEREYATRTTVELAHHYGVSHGTIGNWFRRLGVTAKIPVLKTACKRGHPFTAANTGVSSGIRFCRQCKKATEKERRRVRNV